AGAPGPPYAGLLRRRQRQRPRIDSQMPGYRLDHETMIVTPGRAGDRHSADDARTGDPDRKGAAMRREFRRVDVVVVGKAATPLLMRQGQQVGGAAPPLHAIALAPDPVGIVRLCAGHGEKEELPVPEPDVDRNGHDPRLRDGLEGEADGKRRCLVEALEDKRPLLCGNAVYVVFDRQRAPPILPADANIDRPSALAKLFAADAEIHPPASVRAWRFGW